MYELQPQGHCRAGAVYIESAEECFADAIAKFGLTVSKKESLEGTLSRDLPHGCFYSPSDKTVFFNVDGTTSYRDEDLHSICIGEFLNRTSRIVWTCDTFQTLKYTAHLQ